MTTPIKKIFNFILDFGDMLARMFIVIAALGWYWQLKVFSDKSIIYFIIVISFLIFMIKSAFDNIERKKEE